MGYFEVLLKKSLKKLFKPKPQKKYSKSSTNVNYSNNDIEAIRTSAQTSVVVLNESLNIANKSNNHETRLSRLSVAKNKLEGIKKMAAQYPFLKICNLNEVEASIAMVENDIMSSGLKEIAHGNTLGQALEKEGKIEVAISQSTQNSDVSSEPKTIGELQNLPISKWGDQDIIKGAKFCATLQLRTPLRILKHHNELFEGDGSPPNYTKELWEGIWVPKTKTFSELGLAIDELPEATMASDIGPIPSNGGII